MGLIAVVREVRERVVEASLRLRGVRRPSARWDLSRQIYAWRPEVKVAELLERHDAGRRVRELLRRHDPGAMVKRLEERHDPAALVREVCSRREPDRLLRELFKRFDELLARRVP